MERTNLSKLILLVVLVALALLGSNTAFGQSPANGTIEERAIELRNLLASIEGVLVEPPRIHLTKDGYLRFIMAPPSTHFAVEPANRGTPEEVAGAFLERWRNLLVNESPAVGFNIIRITTSRSRTYVRYQQTYARLEVFGAQMIIQVNKAGGIEAVISDIMRDTTELDTGKFSLKPSIDPSTAQKKAVEFMASQHPQLEFEAGPATLMIFSPTVVGNAGPTRLVWQTEVGNAGEPIVKELVLVDAHTGEIAFHYSLICNAKFRIIHDYEGRTYDPIYNVRLEGQDPVGIADVDDTYDYLGDTYDFYYDYHGRDSYDNAGANLIAEVRYGVSGAWWYWSYMRIATNEVTDDTVGHEFTHGVTQRESQLGGANEPGAIRESLSDMWGEWIDQTNGAGNDSSAVKWYLFEDWASDPWPWRRMDDPTLCKTSSYYGTDFGDIPQPDRLYGPGWYYGPQDDGGVHHNLGVGNKVCYLLTDGDYFNGYTISGMGISKTADLFYECQTNLLTSSAEYYDLGNVLILAAYNLGLTQTERDNVKNACAAVEILPYPDDCLPICHPDYVDWVLMDRPLCWCYSPVDGTSYQCDGDADGKTETVFKYRIYGGDLNLIVENWKRTIEDPLLNPCADIDHKAETIFKYRVYGNDLNIVVANWKKKDADLPGNCASCLRGQQANASKLTFEDLVKWLEDVWLDPEVRQVINEDAWLKFVESIMEEIQDWLTQT